MRENSLVEANGVLNNKIYIYFILKISHLFSKKKQLLIIKIWHKKKLKQILECSHFVQTIEQQMHL